MPIISRKSPAEKVADAKKMLAKAMDSKKKSETRAKIIFGGYLLKMMRENHKMRTYVLSNIDTNPLRDQDMNTIADELEELRKLAQSEHVEKQPTQEASIPKGGTSY